MVPTTYFLENQQNEIGPFRRTQGMKIWSCKRRHDCKKTEWLNQVSLKTTTPLCICI